MKNWFNRLKVSQKLMLISIFFVMPDSLMLYFFVTGINENIRFARLEEKGNEYQRPLEALVKLIPEHASLAGQSENTAQQLAQLLEKQKQIEAAFDALEQVNTRIGPDLQFTDAGLAKRKREHYQVHTVRKEWRDLISRLKQLPADTVTEQHKHLMADVRMMITHAGDLSNLILDPDLDSYYLMDATLLALPQTQDRLATVVAYGEAVLKKHTISNLERQQLAIYATSLQEADLDRIRTSVETALNEDENFYGRSDTLQARMPSVLKEYTGAAEIFIRLTSQLVEPETTHFTADEYVAAGAKARNASFALWKVADEEIDRLLQKRIKYYEHKRATSLLVAAFALLAAIAFVTFITRSITGPLRQQAAALTAANHALQAEMAERTRAEVELRRSEAQLTAAQKLAHMGSWEWDVPSNKMVWSEENYRIHGVQPENFEATYEGTLQLINPEERPLSDAMVKRALKDGKPFSFEHRIIWPDGTERIIQQCGEVVPGPTGLAVKMFGTAQDVTERKRAEQELENVHQQLLDTSRRAGMAEVATSVLHNVGNVLNSVIVSATLVTDNLRKSKAPNLSKAAELLHKHSADLGAFLTKDPKGKRLPSYLGQLAEHLQVERESALGEIDVLKKHIDHIKEIVAKQQSFAKISGLAEIVKIPDLVEDALHLNATSLTRHDVQVVRDYAASVPEINVDKHKVLQILVNLVRNAKGACDESGRADKRLTVRVANGEGLVKVSVIDNGIGIPKENLTRIFGHGFTTKKDGHGFGLHSGALAARELGGSLNVHSDGPGLGSTFTLELPVSLAE